MKQIFADSIRMDGGTQSRAAINEQTVTEYAEAIQAGVKFPPLTVFFDGADHWLADGFHRFLAVLRVGRRSVAAEVKQGTREDAAWAAAGANATHGLRRTNEDKRKGVGMALKLRPDLSDEAIAQHCGVSREFVNRERRQGVIGSQPDTRTGIDGKRYPVPTKKPAAQVDAQKNEATKVPPVPTRPPHAPEKRKDSAEVSVSAPPGPVAGQEDATGKTIPDNLLKLWDRRTEIDALLGKLSDVRCALKAAQDAGDQLFAEVNTSSAMASLNAAYDALKATKPHAVCPWCHGVMSDQCRACRGCGMIGHFAWERVPHNHPGRKGRR